MKQLRLKKDKKSRETRFDKIFYKDPLISARKPKFPVSVGPLAMYRGAVSAVIARLIIEVSVK